MPQTGPLGLPETPLGARGFKWQLTEDLSFSFLEAGDRVLVLLLHTSPGPPAPFPCWLHGGVGGDNVPVLMLVLRATCRGMPVRLRMSQSR